MSPWVRGRASNGFTGVTYSKENDNDAAHAVPSIELKNRVFRNRAIGSHIQEWRAGQRQKARAVVKYDGARGTVVVYPVYENGNHDRIHHERRVLHADLQHQVGHDG
jgi:hypothetical protein